MDSEGAFDKTTFKIIGLALQEHDVDLTLSWWVRNRKIRINVGGTEIEAVVDRGCLLYGGHSRHFNDHFADTKKRRHYVN